MNFNRAYAVAAQYAVPIVTWINFFALLYVIVSYDPAAVRVQLRDMSTLIAAEVATAKLAHDTFEQRIAALEKIVYGEITPGLAEKSRPITSAEAWQRNRDRELRDRITVLERWRMTQP